jgi:hypothetical protein
MSSICALSRECYHGGIPNSTQAFSDSIRRKPPCTHHTSSRYRAVHATRSCSSVLRSPFKIASAVGTVPLPGCPGCKQSNACWRDLPRCSTFMKQPYPQRCWFEIAQLQVWAAFVCVAQICERPHEHALRGWRRDPETNVASIAQLDAHLCTGPSSSRRRQTWS